MSFEQEINNLNLALKKNKIVKILEIFINIWEVITTVSLMLLLYFMFNSYFGDLSEFGVSHEVVTFYLNQLMWFILFSILFIIPAFILKISSLVLSIKTINLYHGVDDSYKNQIGPNVFIFIGYVVNIIFGIIGAIQFEKQIKSTLENVEKTKKTLAIQY